MDQLLDLSRIGMHLTGGYAPDPEQSTLALVAHHPQAIYFGTRQGRIPAEATPDDVIKGSSRDPSLFHTRDGAVPLADDEPEGEEARRRRARDGRRLTAPGWMGDRGRRQIR